MENDNATPRTTHFATVPEWLFGRVSGNAIAVYGVLDRHADRNGRAFPSRKRMATILRFSDSTVKRAIAELVAAGAIIRHERYREDEDGARTSNEYWLPREPPEVLTPPRVTGDPGARVTGDPTRTKATLNERTPAPRIAPPPIATVDRKRVTLAEYGRADVVLGVFNTIAGTSFASDDWRRKIISRIRDHPDLGAADHEAVIRHAFRSPWWDTPSPSVIYGNAAVFERAVQDWRHGRTGRERGMTPEEVAAWFDKKEGR